MDRSARAPVDAERKLPPCQPESDASAAGAEWPETRDQLIARFCDPDHNGRIWIEERGLFTRFVDEALSRPDPAYDYIERNDQPIPASTLCNRVYNHNFFLSVDTGWIDREGGFWPCGYASHERMLEHMGLNSIEQEQVGWIKLSRRRAMACYAPNNAQIAALVRIAEAVEKFNEGTSAGAVPGANLDFSALMDLPKLRDAASSAPDAHEGLAAQAAQPRSDIPGTDQKPFKSQRLIGD